MKSIIISLFTVLCLTLTCQTQTLTTTVDTSGKDSEYWVKWVKSLYEMGVDQERDTFYVREETLRALGDSAYRARLYPPDYNWGNVLPLLKEMELKMAFWHLINIYMEDTASRTMVINTFLLYDSLMAMDKILLNVYYTYALTDPRVCRITNNKPDIYRPDLLEKHLNVTKDIINIVRYFRKERNKN